MNNQDKNTEDLLRQYINPERSEKAPEGFTSGVMTRLQLETMPAPTGKVPRRVISVPVISAMVTAILIAVAFLLPGNKPDLLALPFLEIINNLKLLLPEAEISSIFSQTLPSVIVYVLIGLLVLTLFDRALHLIFHREKHFIDSPPLN